MRLKAISKVGPLTVLSAMEMLVPFVRMFILTHVLGPFEFGFAAALSAAYATVEQITDTGLFRFVLASPRERYREALATAHGIAVIRGGIVALIFLAVCYPVSCGMVTCGYWPSFAWLAPLTLIKSFENLELRVYERDYRYLPQLIASICSHSCGIVAMIAVGWEIRTHAALLAYLVVQSLAYVALTHILAKAGFSLKLRSPMTREALRYSLPLMMNGAGNAVMAQGDRLFVGAFLGLQPLGLYAVMILTAYVPTSGLFRLIGPIQFAGLMNSVHQPELYMKRMRLYSRAVPIVAAIYALGWVLLGKSFVPTVFGTRFIISDVEILLVGLIVYFRICRTEPATSLLLQSHSTRRLAVANQVPIFGLALGALLCWFWPALESLLAGMAVGEILSLAIMLRSAKANWGPAWQDAVLWSGFMIAFPFMAGVFFAAIGPNDHLVLRLVVGVGCAIAIAIVAYLALLRLARDGYRRPTPPLTPAQGDVMDSFRQPAG